MTSQGTSKIDELEYFPCSCPACDKKTPEKVRRLLLMERERFLAAHNLYACYEELQTIKQSILDGRLWELIETRSRNHPTLQAAFQRMLAYSDKFELETPIRKRKGPFILSEESLSRPEVIRHQQRLLEKYQPPHNVKKLLLLPEEHLRPFREISQDGGPIERLERRTDIHTCTYGLTYAIVPQELLDVYPLSQTETALTASPAAINHARVGMTDYLKRFHYSRCIIVVHESWQEQVAKSIKRKFKGKVKVHVVKVDLFDTQAVRIVMKALK